MAKKIIPTKQSAQVKSLPMDDSRLTEEEREKFLKDLNDASYQCKKIMNELKNLDISIPCKKA